ncbi:hypothetical protein ACWAUC_29255 [Bradyrhizobium guangdongense]
MNSHESLCTRAICNVFDAIARKSQGYNLAAQILTAAFSIAARRIAASGANKTSPVAVLWLVAPLSF